MKMNKNNSCCANCGFMGMPVLNRCSHCGYIGKRLPLIELQGYEHEKLFVEFTFLITFEIATESAERMRSSIYLEDGKEI